MMTWQKIRWMMGYEVLMHWRRRNLPLVAIGFLFALVVLTVFIVTSYAERGIPYNTRQFHFSGSPEMVITEQVGEEIVMTERLSDGTMFEFGRVSLAEYERMIRTTWLGSILIGLLMILLIMIPPMMSDNIAYDRQTGMRELLNALPLAQATYLGGKLLGTLSGIFLIVLGSALIYAPFSRMVVGEYNGLVYILLWLIAILPTALFIAAVVVLLAADLPSRRTATLFGVVMIPLTLAIYVSFLTLAALAQTAGVPFQLVSVPLMSQQGAVVENSLRTYAQMIGMVGGCGVGCVTRQIAKQRRRLK